MHFMRIAALMAWLFLPAAAQVTPLRIVSASPTGELTTIDDAGQVRIVFSEPMVSLGEQPLSVAPEWLTITPAVSGAFYWSGTTTLVFSPAPSQPFPFATQFTIRIAPSATSVRGARLAAPFVHTFSTPTPVLLDVKWRRKSARFDDPVVLELAFNQPMNAETLLPHLTVSLRPHGWTPPALTAAARRVWARTEPAGLAAFDAKVARVREVTMRSDRLELRPSTAKPSREPLINPERIVMLETTTAPPTNVLLDLAIDGSLPGVQGPSVHRAQATVLALDPAFFVVGPQCQSLCDPGQQSTLAFAVAVEATAVAKALSLSDVTTPSRPQRLYPAPNAAVLDFDYQITSLQFLGYDFPPPLSTWQLHVSSDLRSTDGQTLGYAWVGRIETGLDGPALGIGGSVWESSAGPSVPLTTRNVTSLRQKLGPVASSELVPRLNALANQRVFGGATQTAIRRVAGQPNEPHVHPLDVRPVLGSKGTGILTTEIASRQTLARSARRKLPLVDRQVIQVTNLGITVKDSHLSTLVLVTRLDSGAPVANASVTVRDWSNDVIWRGTTDEQGVALGNDVKAVAKPGVFNRVLTVIAEKDGDTAFVRMESRDDSPWLGDRNTDGVRLYATAFTDRGVYRLDEEIHFKTLVRNVTPDGLRPLPAQTLMEVKVRDSRGQVIDERQLRTNEWSSLEWTWRVPARAPLGDYWLMVSRPGTDDVVGAATFLIAAYRRPDFSVDTILTSDPPILGTTLRGEAQARYLFGAPIANGRAKWSLVRRPIQEPPPAVRERFPSEQYAVGYMPQADGRDLTHTVEETNVGLTRDGHLVANFPTTADDSGIAYHYRFEADVEDAGQQHIADAAQLVMHPADLYVALSKPPYFVDIGKDLNVTVGASNLSGQSIAGAAVTVTLAREQWISERHVETGRREWKLQETVAGEWPIQTQGSGSPLAIPIRDGGSYTLRATARDAAGRLTRTEATFYAIGGGPAWRVEDPYSLKVIPEKTTWKVGERARLLVQSPWSQATALVTVEREGVRRHQVMTIRSTQDTVEIPVGAEDTPGIFVSVVLIKGRTSTTLDADGADPGKPAYVFGHAQLDVEDPSSQLRVVVSTDKREYRPRSVANVTARVTGVDGRPAAAEVTLWAVDEGLLSLTKHQLPDLWQELRGSQSLLVRTWDNRASVIGRGPLAMSRLGPLFDARILQTSSAERPIMMALSRAPVKQETEIRQDFRPLAFWLGSVVTDDNGRVSTTVTLPDSLTTYRVMAVAADRESRFGTSQMDVRVTKPLTLVPSFPRFLNRGDRASLTAILASQDGRSGNAVVTLESLTPDRLRVDGAVHQTVPIAAGIPVPVKFDAIAQSRGETRVRMTVRMDGESDAFEVPLSVSEPIRLFASAAYGETTGTAIERVSVPATVDRRQGGLTLDLASTALVGLGEPARYLDEYQYGCAEQQASRALALVLAAELGRAFELSTVKPSEYGTAASAALKELARFQCDDGGFALWEGKCRTQSAYLTAYVLHVLKMGERAGHAPNAAVVKAALAFLEARLPQQPPSAMWWPVWGVEQAFVLKVLAEYGRSSDVQVRVMSESLDRLPIVGLSYFADALASTGDRGPLYQDVVRRLANAIRINADRAHVEEIHEQMLGWIWMSNVNATAAVLDGFVRRKDDLTFEGPLARWLIAAQRNGRWNSTHENALALEALANYHRTLEAATTEMMVTANVGPRTVGRVTIPARSTTAQHVSVPIDELVSSPAGSGTELSLSRAGEGRLYYTARLQYATPESPDPLDRGYAVARRYESYVEGGPGKPLTSFTAGDLVRIRLTVTLRGEGRYLAVTDPLPAGLEPVESRFATTAQRIAEEAARGSGSGQRYSWLWDGGFDHIEQHDDRVLAFATRLSSGTHELTYVARASTAGTFSAPGTKVEAMYAPELEGRGAAATLTVVPRP